MSLWVCIHVCTYRTQTVCTLSFPSCLNKEMQISKAVACRIFLWLLSSANACNFIRINRGTNEKMNSIHQGYLQKLRTFLGTRRAWISVLENILWAFTKPEWSLSFQLQAAFIKICLSFQAILSLGNQAFCSDMCRVAANHLTSSSSSWTIPSMANIIMELNAMLKVKFC